KLALREIDVAAQPGRSTLIDEQPIREAIAELRRQGQNISRVVIATPAISIPPGQPEYLRQQDIFVLRVAHASYVLEQQGIPSSQILTLNGVSDVEAEKVRIRIFGK